MARQPTSMRLRESNQITRIPRVDFTDQRVQAQGLSQLSSSLQRMSSFFLQQSADKARIEGAEYGAANAPTPQQINEAYESGQELELPGDKNTVYGRSVRKAALAIADDEMTAIASNRMSNLAQVFDIALNDETMTDERRAQLAADNGVDDFSPQSFATALDTINAGYASVLDENAPSVARKFRAQAAITANSKYNKYLEAYVKKENQRLENSFLQAHETIFSVESIGDLLTGQGGVDAIKRKRQEQTTKSVTFLEGSEIKTFQDGMDATQKTAAMQVLTDATFAQPDPVGIISDVQENRLGGKTPIGVRNSVQLLKSMGMSNTEIAQELRQMQTEMVNFEENEQAAVNAKAEAALPQLEADVRRAMVAGDDETFKTAIEALNRNNPAKASEMEKEFAEAGNQRTVSDPKVVNELTRMGFRLSFGDVEKATLAGALSIKDQQKFLNDANKFENEEFAETVKYMRGELFQLPENYDAISENDANFEKHQIFTRLAGKLERRLTEARLNRVNYDALEIAKELVAEEGIEITGAENKIKIKSARRTVKFINGFEDELEKINVEKFEDDDFEGVMRFLITQKRMEPRERIPALRSKDRRFIDGFISQLNDGIEASQ